MSESDNIRPEVRLLIQSMIQVTTEAQEVRKWLIVEDLDNMDDHLLELEKHSRNARTAISAIQSTRGR